VRVLTTLSGALAGLMLILVGSMLTSGFLFPGIDPMTNVINIPTTWQVPALLLCAITTGPRSGVISATAYLTIGLFHLPIFHGGGGLTYLLTPSFGYLTGFIPTAWFSGRLSQQIEMNDFLGLTLAAMGGVILLHICGVFNLIIGSMLSLWPQNLLSLLFTHSLVPLPAQITLCPAIAILAVLIRNLLLIE